eukprot:GEMP01072971.1.p1 GENE.GEMP01072971.1~~GEMP01072971.1.p1  ORF type:complete len:353 (+),score=106.24 GEMP01072971.1:89-1147(+)
MLLRGPLRLSCVGGSLKPMPNLLSPDGSPLMGPTLADFRPGGTLYKDPLTPTKGMRKPSWLKMQSANLTEEGALTYKRLKGSVSKGKLSTVCEEAKCPNIGECWAGGTATVMLMGDTCTRACRFCSVSDWNLRYIVVTTVDRDDLPDQGASHIASAISLLKRKSPHILCETLLGDFQGNRSHIDLVARSGMEVYAHNVETVERLTPHVRDRRAGYAQSLGVLKMAKECNPLLVTKSSIMLGVGEAMEEVEQTMTDLRANGVEILTLGQYLQPTKYHMKVHRFVPQEEFDFWRVRGEQLGFAYVASGPLVRSSYRAGEFFTEALIRKRHGGAKEALLHADGEDAVGHVNEKRI